MLDRRGSVEIFCVAERRRVRELSLQWLSRVASVAPPGLGFTSRGFTQGLRPGLKYGAAPRLEFEPVESSVEFMATVRSSRAPRWYAIPVRVCLVTFIATLLCFAVTLLLAILGTVIVGAVRGVHPDMRIAYRLIALPVALVAGSIIFVLALTMEIRHYRQAKALAAIERVS